MQQRHCGYRQLRRTLRTSRQPTQTLVQTLQPQKNARVFLAFRVSAWLSRTPGGLATSSATNVDAVSFADSSVFASCVSKSLAGNSFAPAAGGGLTTADEEDCPRDAFDRSLIPPDVEPVIYTPNVDVKVRINTDQIPRNLILFLRAHHNDFCKKGEPRYMWEYNKKGHHPAHSIIIEMRKDIFLKFHEDFFNSLNKYEKSEWLSDLLHACIELTVLQYGEFTPRTWGTQPCDKHPAYVVCQTANSEDGKRGLPPARPPYGLSCWRRFEQG